MKKTLIVFIVLMTTFVLTYTILLIYIRKKATQDTKVKSDVILVLGGHVISGTSCTGPICKQINFKPMPHFNPCVVARVDQAVSLYKNGYASKILMSGGNDEETNANEADTMKQMAIEAGIPQADILTETKSTSTYENFTLSRKILENAQLHSVIIVTEPYHIARAELVATKLNYKYSLSPATQSICWDKNNFLANWNFLKKEPLAIMGYKIQNKI